MIKDQLIFYKNINIISNQISELMIRYTKKLKIVPL